MIALREFKYGDRSGHVVTVAKGEELNIPALSENRVDVEKLVRTKYAGQESLRVAAPTRKRGRPRKQS